MLNVVTIGTSFITDLFLQAVEQKWNQDYFG